VIIGGTMARKTVEFNARKKVKVPVEVKFKTKSGQRVDFDAHKPVKKTVHVKFKAKTSGK
jgi:hypothetical protein